MTNVRNNIQPLSESEARNLVKRYILSCGYCLEDVDPKRFSSNKKSPDFVLKKKDGNIVAYCELKTPLLKQNPLTKMYHWDTTFYKLRKLLHKAHKQLKNFDSHHEKPWIVIFTSGHFQLNWTNFQHTILGAVTYDGENIIKDFRNKNFLADSNQDILALDMIIWCQISNTNPRNIYQIKFFINQDKEYIQEMINLSKIFRLKK